VPGTGIEAKRIENGLTGYARQAPRVYLDKEALEGVVKAARGPSVLVLSTHAFYRPGPAALGLWDDPLLRCGLLLAGCNNARPNGDSHEGVLTGLEVLGMDLRGTGLVVLSGDETGLGDARAGEGVAGLRQAFHAAGAESVVGSLWQVNDRATAKLMEVFFAGLAKGKDKAAALREAQLRLIEERREDSAAAHPFFWAAFTVTGR
jgi:CHAT domain-containing protein